MPPAEPQGDVEELVARRLFASRFNRTEPLPEEWEAVTPRHKDHLRELGRNLLAAVTPLLYKQWRSEVQKRIDRLAEEAEQRASSLTSDLRSEIARRDEEMRRAALCEALECFDA
jgi:hypothetical protein